MTEQFTCSKCRYYGEGIWSQCGSCELREHVASLEGFKTICLGLLVALGPLGDPELVSRVAHAARQYHREHWGSIEIFNEERIRVVRDRWGDATHL